MINASRFGPYPLAKPCPSALDDTGYTEREGTEGAASTSRPALLVADLPLDHFVVRDGMRYAGTHLIVDLWQAIRLDDAVAVERALRDAAREAGATLLNLDMHCFTPNGGITGVAVLAESHISIHTWPECSYAAVDIFMCGDAEPHRAIDVLKVAFAPAMMTVSEHKRGVMP